MVVGNKYLLKYDSSKCPLWFLNCLFIKFVDLCPAGIKTYDTI